MRIQLLFILLFSFGVNAISNAQTNETIKEYIETYKSVAMQKQATFGIPASITLAQGILESGAGKSYLAVIGFNHFGIKCGSKWDGPSLKKDDDAKQECFRKYTNSEESFSDHSAFLKNNSRYAGLFDYDVTDYTKWAHGLKRAGYATNPRYAHMLIDYIETYELNEYTILALNQNGMDIAEAENQNLIDSKAEAQEVKAIVHLSNGITSKNNINAINGIECVYLEAGKSLLSLSQSHDISVSKLMKYNDLNEDIIRESAYIFLKNKKKKGAKPYVFMNPGRSLWGMSQETGIQLKSLAKFNHISDNDLPSLGEKLYLQKENPNQIIVDNSRIINTDDLVTITPLDIPSEENLDSKNLSFKRSVDLNKKKIKSLPTVKIPDPKINNIESSTAKPVVTESKEIENDIPENEEINFDQMIHIVEPNQTLNILSLLYRVDKVKIMAANGLKSETIVPGMELIIPPYSEDEPEKVVRKTQPSKRELVLVESEENSPNISVQRINKTVKSSNSGLRHQVRSGETLFSISNKYNISIEALKEANNQSSNNINVGEHLNIPSGSGIIKETKQSNEKVIHRVAPGENLYRISLKYGVTMEEIIKWNKLSSDQVYVGQKLDINP